MTARAPRRRAAVAGGGSTHGAANGHVPLCCRAEAGGVLAGILSAALLASTGCRARSPRAARAAARRRDHPPRRPPPQAPHPRGTRASRLPETALPPQYAPLGRSGRAAAAAAHGRRPPPQPQRLPHRPALARGRAAAAVAPARQRLRGAASGQPPCRSGSRRWRKALPSRRGRATARPPPHLLPHPSAAPAVASDLVGNSSAAGRGHGRDIVATATAVAFNGNRGPGGRGRGAATFSTEACPLARGEVDNYLTHLPPCAPDGTARSPPPPGWGAVSRRAAATG